MLISPEPQPPTRELAVILARYLDSSAHPVKLFALYV